MKKFLKNNVAMFLFFASAVVVLVLSVYTSSLMNDEMKALEHNTQMRLLTVSKSAARLVTSEELNQFQTVADMQTPEYEEIRQRLNDFTEDSGVLFTYYLRPVGDKLQFIIDSDPNPATQVGLHSAPVDMEYAPQQALGGTATSAGIGNYSVNWDGILAAYAPVYNERGEVVAIAGVDISDEQIIYANQRIRTLTIAQIATLVVALACGFASLYLYRNKAQQAEAANAAKSQFLSRMSHEIRTPMNAIIGLCRMAKETEDLENIRFCLDNITASSSHLLELINDILDLSTIESGRSEPNEAPANLEREIETICLTVQPQIEAKHHYFKLDIDPCLPKYARCDATRIRQVAINLLSNAIKFTPYAGELSFSIRVLERRGDTYDIEWRVTDNGIGIEKNAMDTIFNPFEQGDGGDTRKFGGTGLGLAISKQLVDLMGGELHVESVLGQGSSFYFCLTLKCVSSDSVQEEKLMGMHGTPIGLSGKKVLLVEDSEINQLIAQHMFEGFGAAVDIAENGNQALQKYLAQPSYYHLVLMDIQMPVMDGYEATRRIRASGLPDAKTIPIIALSANVFKEDVEKALSSGMNAHIGKPFETEQVEKTLHEVLNI